MWRSLRQENDQVFVAVLGPFFGFKVLRQKRCIRRNFIVCHGRADLSADVYARCLSIKNTCLLPIGTCVISQGTVEGENWRHVRGY